MIDVVIVDDERLVQTGFQMILESTADIRVVETCTGIDAVQVLERTRPDVLLLDLYMPEVDGVEVLRSCGVNRQQRPFGSAVVLTTFAPDEKVVEAVHLGADGFLFKDLGPQELIDCVRQAAAGRSIFTAEAGSALREALSGTRFKPDPQTLAKLSDRERDVLACVSSGLTNAEAASSLHLSPATVKDYVSRLLDKLGCENRTQLATLSTSLGLTDHEPT